MLTQPSQPRESIDSVGNYGKDERNIETKQKTLATFCLHNFIFTESQNWSSGLSLECLQTLPIYNSILTRKCGYACKDSEPTGATAALFKDMVNVVDATDADQVTGKSMCTKMLIKTVGR